MSREDRFAKWKAWLDTAIEETTQLLISREVYIEVRNVVAANPAVRTDNRLISWMTHNYVQSMLIGVRRLLDRDKRSVSLVRLLNDMEEHCDLLTREAHVRLYRLGDDPFDDEMIKLQANRTFDSLAGEGVARFPTRDLESDREKLFGLWGKLKPLANKRVAHFDEGEEIGELPRYEDLDKVVDELERQVMKYYLLLEAKSFTTLQPVPQYDWKAIFRVPWIVEPGTRQGRGGEGRATLRFSGHLTVPLSLARRPG